MSVEEAIELLSILVNPFPNTAPPSTYVQPASTDPNRFQFPPLLDSPLQITPADVISWPPKSLELEKKTTVLDSKLKDLTIAGDILEKAGHNLARTTTGSEQIEIWKGFIRLRQSGKFTFKARQDFDELFTHQDFVIPKEDVAALDP
jgi:hypothetical protein